MTDQYDLLSWQPPPQSLYKDLALLVNEWHRTLGYDPWTVHEDMDWFPDSEGWSINGYSSYPSTSEAYLRYNAGRPMGLFWIISTNFRRQPTDEAAIAHVRRSARAGDRRHQLAIEIHDLADILRRAQHVR